MTWFPQPFSWNFSQIRACVFKLPNLFLTWGVCTCCFYFLKFLLLKRCISYGPLILCKSVQIAYHQRFFPTPQNKETPPSPSISYHPFSPLFFIAFVGIWYIIIWILMLFIIHLSSSLSLQPELRLTCFLYCISYICKYIFIEWRNLTQ